MAFGALGLFGSMVLVLLGILTLPQNELVVLLGAALAIDPSTPTALYAGTSEGTVGLRAALDLDLRSYAALAGMALTSFPASSMALATPSLRATVFTRARPTPLSLFRAARY